MQENTTLLKVKSRDNEPDNERPLSWKQQRQTLLELENTKQQYVFFLFELQINFEKTSNRSLWGKKHFSLVSWKLNKVYD